MDDLIDYFVKNKVKKLKKFLALQQKSDILNYKCRFNNVNGYKKSLGLGFSMRVSHPSRGKRSEGFRKEKGTKWLRINPLMSLNATLKYFGDETTYSDRLVKQRIVTG